MAIPGLTGIGSGMDIKGMVDALVNAERAPKAAQINRLEKDTTAKFTALSQFKNALATFQDSLKKLDDPALFEKRSVSSGKPDVFSVTADATAVSGNYGVQVFNLAQTSKIALAGVDDPAAAVGTGKLNISVGETSLDIDITDDNSSLTGIRDAINAAGKDSGLSATIVNDPDGEGGARLVLSSTQAGTGNDIRVEVTPVGEDSLGLSILAYTPPAPDAEFTPTNENESGPRGPRVISYARDANLAIDGIRISSSSNTVEGAIQGVTLNLKAAQSADEQEGKATISLDVAEDRGGVKKSITEFVDAYNKMLDTVNSLTRVTAVGGGDSQPLSGELVGDASVRSFMSAMRSTLGSVSGSEDGIRILADLGVTTQRDGKLAVDDDKLDKTLENNFEQLNSFLTGENGLMARLSDKVDPYTQTGGILENRTKSLQNVLNGRGGVDDQREALDRRVAKIEARMLSQFNAMDALLGQMAGTSNYLTSVLDSLPGVVKKSK